MKTRIALPFVIGLLLVSQPAVMASGTAIAFDDLPRLVKERNENVQAAQSTWKAQEKRTGALARSFLPRISASAGGEQYKAGSDPQKSQEYWRLQASVNLYRGGRDVLENRARGAAADTARTEVAKEYQQELKEARQTFWKLLAAEKILIEVKESLKRNEENLKSSRRRSGAGVATAADALQFDLHRTTLNQELKKVMLERDLLRNRLSVSIGLDEHESLSLAGEFPAPSEKPWQTEAPPPDQILDVKVFRGREKAELAKQEQAARWWHPKVDVYTSYSLPSLADDFSRANRREKELAAGFRVGIDLGEGLESRSESQARALDADALARRAAHKTREVIAADHEYRHDLKVLRELILDADQNVEKTEKFLKLTESEYNRGVKNGPDLLGAFEKFYEFRQKRIVLYREFHETSAELSALTAAEELP